jgi:hypothetical protein
MKEGRSQRDRPAATKKRVEHNKFFQFGGKEAIHEKITEEIQRSLLEPYVLCTRRKRPEKALLRAVRLCGFSKPE